MSTTQRKPADKVEDAAKTATAQTHAQLNEGVERMTKGMTQFGTFAQENTEAFMQAASTMAKGLERVAQENADFAKKQFEESSERMQSLTKAKTPQEFVEHQSDIFRLVMESQISQVNKVSDMMIATAKDAQRQQVDEPERDPAGDECRQVEPDAFRLAG